jgi:hypothetical protein
MPPEWQRPSQAWRERTPLFLPLPRSQVPSRERAACDSFLSSNAGETKNSAHSIDECPKTTARQNTTSITRPHFAAECFDFMTL